MSKKRFLILLAIFILAGGFLRIFPVEYASMRMYDNQLVTEAFDLGEGIARGDFSILKTPVKYPYFFPYILLFFYGVFYFFGKLAGLFYSAQEFVNYIFFHLDKFYDFARILIGILGTLLIPLVYIVTSKVISLKNKKNAQIAGLFASFLMAFNLLHIQFSHQERPHILVAFFVFLSFYFFILFLEKRNLSRFLLLGLSIGLAAGCLHNGLLAVIFFVLIVLFSKFKYLLSYKFWLGALVFLAIFIICYPYVFLSFNQAFNSGGGHPDITFSGSRHGVGNIFDLSGIGFKSIAKGLFVYDPSLVMAFLLCLLIYFLFYKRNQTEVNPKQNIFRQAIIGGISFTAIFILVFGLWEGSRQFRIIIPLIPFACFFSGILVSEILERFNKKFLRTLFALILILFSLFSVVQASRFSYLMFKKEIRDFAKEWIEKNIPSSDLIALEDDNIRFIPTKKILQLQTSLDPDSLSRQDKFLLTLDSAAYPKGSRAILRLWAFEHQKDLYRFLKEQEVKYFIISKFAQTNDSRLGLGLEKKILSDGGTLFKKFSPFIGENSSGYSDFPNEFKNPIIDLWTIEQIDPIIEIYKL